MTNDMTTDNNQEIDDNLLIKGKLVQTLSPKKRDSESSYIKVLEIAQRLKKLAPKYKKGIFLKIKRKRMVLSQKGSVHMKMVSKSGISSVTNSQVNGLAIKSF